METSFSIYNKYSQILKLRNQKNKLSKHFLKSNYCKMAIIGKMLPKGYKFQEL